LIKINLLNKLPQSTQFFYKTGDAMSAPTGPNHFLLHSCNCKGVWGKGFALAVRHAYGEIYKENNYFCRRYGESLRGTFKEFTQGTRNVTCLYTSDGYGDAKDPRSLIVQNTHRAVAAYFWYRRNHKGMVIHSPRINFGLFAIPWSITADIIREHLTYYPNIKWVVWVPVRESPNKVSGATSDW
jgi:O-acetyl-ADP-ribose deacetylase (regulator of RNase III)